MFKVYYCIQQWQERRSDRLEKSVGENTFRETEWVALLLKELGGVLQGPWRHCSFIR